MNSKNKNNSKKISLLLLFLFFVITMNYAQITGDYRSVSNANWATASSWQTYNGSTWIAATSYPGQNAGNYSVTIAAGNTVSIPNTGITTNSMGILTINGQLTLNGGTGLVAFNINTPQIIITSGLTPAANIYFINKCTLTLPTDAIIKVGLGGLAGECNNNEEIYIGSSKFAVCNGAPGDIFTFAELMAGGGTINSTLSISSTDICLGESVQLTGSYSGAVVTSPTYNWSNTGAGTQSFSPSATSQNTTITPTIAGSYFIALTVTTINDGTSYSNTERVTLTVNSKSGNPTSAVAGTDSLMLGKTTTLTLVGGGGGNNETVRWYSSSCGGTLVGAGNPLTVSPTATTTYYGRYENATPCNYVTTCATVTIPVIPFANVWKGTIDTDFAKNGNWLDNILPTSGQDIVFDPNPNNNCILDVDRIVGYIRNPSTKNLVTNGHQLSINGVLNFSNSGKIDAKLTSSRVAYSGSIIQTLSSNSFIDSTIYNLKIQNTIGVQLSRNLTITNNVQILNGAKLTIPVLQSLKVLGSIDNQAGSSGLLIQSTTLGNATLIFNNAAASPIQATVEMYSKASKATTYKWQFFGIPIRSTTATPTFDGSYVREMHEDNTPAHWYQLNNASTLTSFTGYEVTQLSPVTISFRGELENRDFNSGKLAYTSGVTYPGQHLIGNPYTAAIDIKKIGFGSSDPTIIENTVYLYNTGSFADWTNQGEGTTSGTSPGQYISIPILNAGQSGIPAQIPSMQAFLLRIKSDNDLATISIPYSSTGTVVKNTDIQRVKNEKNAGMRIEVNGTRFSDQMWIFAEPSCSHNFDNGWDGYKIQGSPMAPQIYAIEPDGDYQVNTVDDINNTELGFISGIDSIYTLTFTNENLETLNKSVYLIDLLDSTTTDITQSGTKYTFSSCSSGSQTKRFKIITNTTNSTIITEVGNNKLNIFSSQKKIIVNNLNDASGTLMLYDITGKYIQKSNFRANTVTTIPTNLPVGLYVIKSTISNQIHSTYLEIR